MKNKAIVTKDSFAAEYKRSQLKIPNLDSLLGALI